MPSPPPPLSLLMPPRPLPCTVLPCTKASDIPGLNSVQPVPSHHRREHCCRPDQCTRQHHRRPHCPGPRHLQPHCRAQHH
jgi:hypothetical protein